MKTTVLRSMSFTLISALACLSVAACGEVGPDDEMQLNQGIDEIGEENVSEAEQGLIVVGRISYWQGKVNLHTDPTTSVWTHDSDCNSGAQIDPLTYCKKFYPTTTSVTSVDVTKKPPQMWNTAGCYSQYSGDGLQEWTCNVPESPRIAYWPGKVNLHRDSGGNWTKDSDCSSGAGINPLIYCKKFYPATTSATSVPVSAKPPLLWNTAGCTAQYSGDGVTEYTCNP